MIYYIKHKTFNFMRSEVLTAAIMSTVVFWLVILCRIVGEQQYIQFSALKMAIIHSSKMLVPNI